MAWLGTWKYRRQLTIDNTHVSADLSSFPILVLLNNVSGITSVDVTSIFTELTTNKLKLAITTSDGTTQCSVEVVNWDNATPKAELWVNVPTVTTGSTTILYLYYDSSQADNSANVGVPGSTPGKAIWDASFEAVFHMDDNPDTSNILDSTSHGLTMAKGGAGTPAEVAGLLNTSYGKSQHFTPSQYAERAAIAVTNSTLEALIYIHVLPANSASERIVCDTTTGTTDGRQITLTKSSDGLNLALIGAASKSSTVYVALMANPVINTLYHVAAVFNDATPAVTFYVNGVSFNDANPAGFASAPGATANFAIGRRPDASSYYDGIADEVRVSSAIRPIAWILATYYTEIDGIITYGSETTNGASGSSQMSVPLGFISRKPGAF
jgi:hypothetical protein